MTKRQKQSREEWEQELWEKQRNLTFDQSQRAVSHIAKGRNLPTLNTTELLLLVLGTVLLVLAIAASNWSGPYSTVFALTAAAVVLCFILKMVIGPRR